MGRGGYHGGSSTVGAGGSWSTYDPAESRSKPIRTRPRSPKASSTKPIKRTAKSVLGDIVFGIAAGKGVSSKNVPIDVLQAIRGAGGAVEWAKQQPRFEYLLLRASEAVARQKSAKDQKRKIAAARKAARRQREAASRLVQVPRDVQQQKWLSEIGIERGELTPFFGMARDRVRALYVPGRSAVEVARALNSEGLRTASGSFWTRRLVLLVREHLLA